MSDLVLVPDAEQLVSEYLRSRSELEELVEARIYTVLPRDPEWPLVRLHRNGGTPLKSRPLWVDEPRIQLEAYGGPKKQAQQVAETCRAVLAEADEVAHAVGVVTGVRFLPLLWLPDPTYTPARARYVFDCVLTLHAHPGGDAS